MELSVAFRTGWNYQLLFLLFLFVKFVLHLIEIHHSSVLISHVFVIVVLSIFRREYNP